MGELDAAGTGLGEGEGAAAVASGNVSALWSGSLTTKVPSRPSTCAYHIPSGVRLPIVNLCRALSSGEVVKVITSVAFSKP